MNPQAVRLVAVYGSDAAAHAAGEAARRAGAPSDRVHIGDPNDRRDALEGEMREEINHAFEGPGVAPLTGEMSKGTLLGVVVGAAVGAVIAIPFAAIGFGGWDLWLRLLVVVIVGAVVGATVGWIVGGGFAARRPEERLAAERGVTVTTPASEPIERALVAANPIRLDEFDMHGQPVATVTTEGERGGAPGVVHEIGRHLAREERDS
jgi:hypothetical protein